MKVQHRGFTLVELIVVIVILGILAATALPRFINVQTEARTAAVQGIAGGVRSAASVVISKWVVVGSTGAATVTMADSSTVAVSTGTTGGIPTGAFAGIGTAMRCESATACQGLTVAYGSPTTTFWPAGGSATCQVSYDDTNGNVTPTTTGC